MKPGFNPHTMRQAMTYPGFTSCNPGFNGLSIKPYASTVWCYYESGYAVHSATGFLKGGELFLASSTILW